MPQTVRRYLFAFFILLVTTGIIFSTRPETAEASSKPGKGGKRRQSAPSYSNEVVRIMQRSCQTCHHPGDIAPFSMMTYRETRPWAQAIREQVLLRKMPPWKPVPGCGDFRDARGLSNEEIQTIVAWVDAGAPEGNTADLPVPLEFPDGWPLGAPDLVLNPDSDYTPPTQGDMYRCFSVPVSGLRGDRWINALSVRPGNSKIVHHVIAYPDPNGVSAQLDARDPEPGYTCFGGPGFDTTDFLGGWAPGSRGYFAPDGTGIKLANNSRVVIQVHYHPTGEQETDRTPIGLYFAKSPVRKQLQALPLLNNRFAIPPGAKNYEVTAEFIVPAFLSAQLWALTPHMHLLGKKIKVELTKPGLTQPDCLVNIEDWDFNWQGTYVNRAPVPLAGGSRLKLTTIYDNSSDNPRNPNNPPRTVRWGEETTDEMSLAFIGFTLDAANLPISTPLLSEVTVGQNGNLVATGSGFLAGADIEINGRSLPDTIPETAGRLSSSELWKVYAAPGQEVSVTVLNPDGVRTPERSFVRQVTARSLSAVSAASYRAESLAAESIAAAFGANLATGSLVATTTPLPTNLAGTTVRVNGVLAPLFFVAPGQVNLLIPSGTLTGGGVIEIQSGDNVLSRGTINLTSAAAGLFTANALGTGAPAAVATRDGINYFTVGNADGTPNRLDPGDYLVLFGTGIRQASRGSLKITIGGIESPILYAGAQGSFAGLDQINTQVPAGISGIVDLVVTVNGKPANAVKVKVM